MKTKKSVKSHLRANILVSPRMHKSFGNYSYMRAEKLEKQNRKTTRTCWDEMWMWRNESSTKSEKHNHTYFSFSWFYRETSFTIIFMFRLQTIRAVWEFEGRKATTIDHWKIFVFKLNKVLKGESGWARCGSKSRREKN